MPNAIRFKSKEEYNAWFREYRVRNAEKLRAYHKKWNKVWRAKNGTERSVLLWKLKNPEKYKAQTELHRAVERGEITKEPCEVCGEQAVAHHDDYTKPLKIRWLCKIHHRQQHYTEYKPDKKKDKLLYRNYTREIAKRKKKRQDFFNEITKMRKNGMKLKEIGDKFNSSTQRISAILVANEPNWVRKFLESVK